MKVNEEFFPMLMLELSDKNELTATFRTPSPQLYKSVQEKGLEGELSDIMSRLGDSLEARVEHMNSMLPTNQLARRANATR